MAQITFYPIGNADCSLTEFADERLMLIDYCHRKEAEDDKDKRVNLPDELEAELDDKDRDYFDVVGFTHADNDHCDKAEEFFWFDHAKKYQGEGRKKIKDLWVPACFVLETGLEGSARIIREEARHRLREGKGVHVFGQPDALDKWFADEKIDPKSRKGLIWTAGKCIPTFSREKGSAEIFVHSPFSFRMEDDEEDRNNASIVLHVTFFEGERATRAMYGADSEHQAWTDIVQITSDRGRNDRLIWDVFKISHHCSYTALSDEKGKDKTEPVENVKFLFEQGQERCYLISSSDTIPNKDTSPPPHKQAAAYYREVADDKDGGFLVTMEEPSEDKPEAIIIVIDEDGPDREEKEGKGSRGGFTKRAAPTILGGGRFA